MIHCVSKRRALRRVYFVAPDLEGEHNQLRDLLGNPLAACNASVDGTLVQTFMLDFGPALFNGWAASLAAKELGVTCEIVDFDAGELVVGGSRVGLTRLELGVMQYLEEHEGEIVGRDEILDDVWGHDQLVGGNVVDTKISSLRKKLGEYAPMIETVSRAGYRYRKV